MPRRFLPIRKPFSKICQTSTHLPISNRSHFQSSRMGRELQKKKNRSSVSKVTRRSQNRRKKTRITGSALVAAQWDKSQTLSQKYTFSLHPSLKPIANVKSAAATSASD